VGSILAETGDMACPDLFPVALLAVAFVVALVRPVGECDAVFQFENLRAVFSKSGHCHEKNYRN
jgi:hypothetical protein